MNSENTPRDTRSARVATRRHPVDLGDPAPSTGEALQRVSERPGAFYINPRYEVSAAEPTPEFFQAARRAQRQWCRTMNQFLGSSNRRRHAKSLDPIERMLTHTGLLLVDGVVICPKAWESLTPWTPPSSLNPEKGAN